MPRFYVCLSLLLIPLFVLLALTMSAISSTQPINPALRGFVEGCEGIPQPCWYGIVPGVTIGKEAETILENVATRQENECTFRVFLSNEDNSNPIHSLYFTNCSGIRLGDVLAFTGTIDGFVTDVDKSAGFGTIYLVTGNGKILIQIANSLEYATQISLSMEIDNLWFHSMSQHLQPWTGFVPFWRVCEELHIEGYWGCQS